MTDIKEYHTFIDGTQTMYVGISAPNIELAEQLVRELRNKEFPTFDWRYGLQQSAQRRLKLPNLKILKNDDVKLNLEVKMTQNWEWSQIEEGR